MMRTWAYVFLFYFSMLIVINASWFSVLNQASQRKTHDNPEENNFINQVNASYEEAELLRKHLMKEKYNQRSLRKNILKIRKLHHRNLTQTKTTFAETLNKLQREAAITLSKEKSLLLEKTKRQLEVEKMQEIKDLERKYLNEIENVKEELRRVSSENSRLQVNIDDIKGVLLKSESEKEALQSQLHLSTNAMRQEMLDLQAQLAQQQSQSSKTRNHWPDEVRAVEVNAPQQAVSSPEAPPVRGARHRSSSRRPAPSLSSTRSKHSSEQTNTRDDQ